MRILQLRTPKPWTLTPTLYNPAETLQLYTHSVSSKAMEIASGVDLVEGVSHEDHGSRAPPIVGERVLHPAQSVT